MSRRKNNAIIKHMQFMQGFRSVNKRGIGNEALAGLTLAVISIPEVMGYTKISGTPIVTGIYTILLPMIVFALFGASRHLVVAADSATAAILAQGIIPLAAAGSSLYMSYVCLLSLMVGILLIICRILRFGFIAKFLSRTVLVGFLTGVGIQVSLGQIGGMLGVQSGAGGTLKQLTTAVASILRTNPYALAVTVLVIILILLPDILKKYAKWIKRIPWALIAVIAAAAVGYFLNLTQKGVPSVGIIQGGLPHFSIPEISFGHIASLFSISVTIVIVIITQSAATSSAYANRYNESFNENTDLLGLGLANVIAGLNGTFVVNGSPTKTQIADEAGGKTQLTNIFAAVIAAIVLLFLTGPLQFLPDAALSALVFTIGIKLIDIKSMKRIYKQKPNEFVVALLTAAVVVVVGAAQGIIFAMGMALIEYLRRSYRPKNSLMAPIETSNGRSAWIWQPLALHAEIKQIKQEFIVYHFAASIYYANADFFAEEVLELSHTEPVPKNILLDFSAIADVDYTGGQVLAELCRNLSLENIQVGLVQVESHVMSELSRYGIMEMIGQHNIYHDMSAAVLHFSNQN
ncbi:MAG: SulP family inorganic anion transporter [Oscillospiraceae bacterium]|nr:SulP family inorganic anion transporter [Oscillospiraceae bacterium]